MQKEGDLLDVVDLCGMVVVIFMGNYQVGKIFVEKILVKLFEKFVISGFEQFIVIN